MNPNSTFILPSKADDADEEFVAKWLDKHGLKAVDKRHITLCLGGHNAAHLVQDLRDAHARTNNAALALVADAIACQTKPPKPPEPTGLGAVVEDEREMRWVRARTCDGPADVPQWRSWPAGIWHYYADIDAVRVLSEGVAQ